MLVDLSNILDNCVLCATDHGMEVRNDKLSVLGKSQPFKTPNPFPKYEDWPYSDSYRKQ